MSLFPDFEDCIDPTKISVDQRSVSKLESKIERIESDIEDLEDQLNDARDELESYECELEALQKLESFDSVREPIYTSFVEWVKETCSGPVISCLNKFIHGEEVDPYKYGSQLSCLKHEWLAFELQYNKGGAA